MDEQDAHCGRSFKTDPPVGWAIWRRYVDLVQTKPGALRNGAPFKTMPPVLRTLLRHLLCHAGGDRVMT